MRNRHPVNLFPAICVVDPVEACRECSQTGSRSLECQFSVNRLVDSSCPDA
jgi:hypothetical protein